VQLTNQRLLKIAEFVGKSDCICDIGTDHAYLPIYLVEKGQTRTAIASDVRKGPLRIAHKNIVDAGLSEKISIILSDGFAKFSPKDFDVAVIAGMGGHLLIEIISRNLPVSRSVNHLVVQPNMDIEFCREWLFNNKFDIIKEVLVRDAGKIYVIMKVVPVEKKVAYNKDDVILGPHLKFGHDPLMELYVDKLIKRRKKRLTGLLVSGTKENLFEADRIEADLLLIRKVEEDENSRHSKST